MNSNNSRKRLWLLNRKLTRQLCGGDIGRCNLQRLRTLTEQFGFSITAGDVRLLDGTWYVTHTGLIKLACKRHCAGIETGPIYEFCDPAGSRWAFKATVYTSRDCKGFAGYGDADPSNVSPLVRGAEMRVAETRAVNRALRKAYGIGICSVEELGPFTGPGVGDAGKRPPQPANGHSGNGQPRLRDRLCQLIRQHQLDPVLVKSYAVDFCGVKSLGDAKREQIEAFINHLADWAEKDKNALLCQLNSYLRPKEGAA